MSIAVLERTYLVSTSRIHGANSEGLQTIHVLKDITDRREAERRYRELFDNIQEGLFFSTPEGRFIEVNDALVRMLGYTTAAKSCCKSTFARSFIFPPSSAKNSPTQPCEQHGVAAQPRRNSAPQRWIAIHVLINAFAVRDSQRQHRAVSRPDARYQRAEELSVRTAARSAISPARF